MGRRKSDSKHLKKEPYTRNYLSFIQKPYEDEKLTQVDRSFPNIDHLHQKQLSSNKSYAELENITKTPPKSKGKNPDRHFDLSPYLKKEGSRQKGQKLPKIIKKWKNPSLERFENSYIQRSGRNEHPLGNIRVVDYFYSGEQGVKHSSLEN